MKTKIHWFAIALCTLSTHLFAQEKQDEIIATWYTGEAKVEIYQEGERYIGNPINPAGERVTDIEVLNLEYDQGKWTGKIYARKRDKLFDVECQIKGEVLHLEVDAGFRSRELQWIQAN